MIRWAALNLRDRVMPLVFTVDPVDTLAALNGPGNVATNLVALSFVTRFPKGNESPLKIPIPFSQFALQPTGDRKGPIIDLGPASLRRTVTRFSALDGGTLWGLEEEFVP